MAKITLGGNEAATSGQLPTIGTQAPNFSLVAIDLSEKTLSDYGNHKKILNIFPSVNTGVCATSVRKFNQEASKLNNVKVLCITRD